MRLNPIRSGSAALLTALLFTCARGSAAGISAPDQSAAPGQTVVASIAFSGETQPVSGIQFDLEWDAGLDVKVAIGDPQRTSLKLLYAAPLGPRLVRCMLFGIREDVVTDGEVLKLFVVVDGSAQAGTAQVRFTNVTGTDPAGNPVSLRSAPINVQIQGATAQPNSNWSTPFVKIALPAVIAGTQFGIRGAAIGPDGYAYIGSAAGVYRALTGCIAASPANTGCWSAINNGAPAAVQGAPDPYLSATAFDFVAGRVVAGWLDAGTGHLGRVCSWDSTSQIWACNKSQTPDPFALGTGTVTHDGNNNLYAGSSSIYKSTDGGATWTDQTSGDAYGSIGLTTGALFDIKVWGGWIYWGGEGPLIKQPLNFSSFQNLLPTANGGCTAPNCYAHNMRGTIADGNASVGAQSEVIGMINHCNGGVACTSGSGYIQRLNVATNTWSPSPDATIPGGTSLYWTIRRLAQGYTAHEFYAVGGGGLTGVLGSVDGGATWTLLGNGQTWSAPTNPSAMSLIGVSPIDDSKIAARQADAWFQPGPTGGPGIQTLPPNAILNSASLLTSAVAPGEIVTFFGVVPSAPVTLLFNNTPAPVLYAGSNQINAIVPFGLDVSGPANIELRSNGQIVANGVLPVVPVAPAIFTQSGTGTGAGAILNQDYSLNSGSNPAAANTVIMIYGTGFGAVNPAAVDGRPAGGLASTVRAVTASIGGIPAMVTYAGAAPGLVAGVVQINVLVPPGLRTNPATPLSLSAGSAGTPAGTTVSIR